MCLQLFLSFFSIGSFTFGGGFAMIPLIERDVVQKHKWMSSEEFVDMIAVTQSAPGPVAVNSAVFTGYKLAGLSGAVASLLGVTLPSFLIILAIAVLLVQGEGSLLQRFFLGVRPAVAALILGVGLNMGKKYMNGFFDYLTAGLGFLLLIVLQVHPILLILFGAVFGILKNCARREGRR